MRVVHVSPVNFGSSGTFGGGERYPRELAKAMAAQVPTTLITFADSDAEFTDGDLRVQVLRRQGRYRSALNPLSTAYLPALRGADIVHTHHLETLTTDLTLLSSRTSRRVFTTDHGGKAPRMPGYRLIQRRMTGLLAVSRFSAQFYPHLHDRTSIIYGGVDTNRFRPSDQPRTGNVVFVGRLLPHKGIDILIRALPEGCQLDIYGRRYSDTYRAVLTKLADGKKVTFHEDADDDEIRRAYQTAGVAVLPSVYQSAYGPGSPRSELLGLTLLEAMACGTPVIATAVGGMPEIVSDGRTGLIVPPSDIGALQAALTRIQTDRALWAQMSREAAARVAREFSWAAVSQRCLDAYRQYPL
ncbi:glycosyltransferase family 4 protein [Dactylosporangium vinaceum]|uniref:Glycosyltransferase family 4 protein n=1 Tax=Dactylosporangium vinaceum TaxID=53362 RepID=A0ABV5MIF8_9ACTN|nr:glycosyltransferase family 4 protein [Dactylosporangium vinaceum]UAB97606.1 glycosyltransferase family 4 protein [Dactylosporangium vinaceum]